MMRERRDNGFVSSLESVAALRFERFGKLFNESVRLEHLKQKKKRSAYATNLSLNTELLKLFLEVSRD